MGKIGPKEIRIDGNTSRMDLLNALHNSKMKGTLQAREVIESGAPVYYLKKESQSQQFLAALGIRSSQRNEARAEVADALRFFAVSNARDQQVDLKSLYDSPAPNIKAERLQAQLLDPIGANTGIEGNKVLAAFAGAPLSLALVSPMNVKADAAIIRSGTLMNAARDNKKLSVVGDLVDKFQKKTNAERLAMKDSKKAGEIEKITNQHLVTSSVICMADLNIDAENWGTSCIGEDDLAKMYRSLLEGKSGTVVLEPFPDYLLGNVKKGNLESKFSDNHLRVLIDTTRNLTAEAAKKRKPLHVTIATEDHELFNRIQTLSKSKPSPKKGPGLIQT